MPTVTQTTTNLYTVPATKPSAFYDKTLLKVLRQRQFLHEKYAQKRDMPKNAGDTINFRKIGTLPVATTPLTEGVTPDGNSASISAITVSTEQYGDYIQFSDKVSFESIDPIITEYTVEQGNQAGNTLDVLVRDVLTNGSNVFYAAGRTSRVTVAAADKFSMTDIRKIVRNMKKNHVEPLVDGHYLALISPSTWYDIFDDATFDKMMNYGNNNKPLIDGELGRIFNVVFVETPNAKVFAGAGATGADVQATMILGKGSYGVTRIKGEGDVQTIVKGLGSAGSADPLNQRQTIGWKVNAFAAVILDQQCLTRYEHGATV
jgi:N4-gp56 family major capsid protein